ncbi:hypothetical protein BDA99DRAFT_558186 [Phascolomyces articulosus]|uniref:Uncharacterized protein n=1 Tax=Phascolomyces articulosus TaxID=60185 RepID=A0AAD5K3H7_9FUNG|nr:hypothetical protein BDA99DRAFT_558186 [Phascolomyces articulosus]
MEVGNMVISLFSEYIKVACLLTNRLRRYCVFTCSDAWRYLYIGDRLKGAQLARVSQYISPYVEHFVLGISKEVVPTTYFQNILLGYFKKNTVSTDLRGYGDLLKSCVVPDIDFIYGFVQNLEILIYICDYDDDEQHNSLPQLVINESSRFRKTVNGLKVLSVTRYMSFVPVLYNFASIFPLAISSVCLLQCIRLVGFHDVTDDVIFALNKVKTLNKVSLWSLLDISTQVILPLFSNPLRRCQLSHITLKASSNKLAKLKVEKCTRVTESWLEDYVAGKVDSLLLNNSIF